MDCHDLVGPNYQANYVCVNGNSYYINENKISIDDAKKYCQTAFGSKIVGRLYEPKDKATYDLVIKAANRIVQDWLWLGINDKSSEGQFQYFTTGGNLHFTNWRTGEPNDSNWQTGRRIGEDCVIVNVGKLGYKSTLLQYL